MRRAEILDRTRAWPLSPLLSVLLIVVVAGVLRWLFLGAKSLDLDEAFSLALARDDWRGFVDSLMTSEGHMALYYALLRLWRAFGESEAAVRTLSVLPAVAAVPLLYALGARLFGYRVGLIAVLLLCVNAFHVKYAQEARGYSLVMLLITASSYFLVRSVEEPSQKRWWAGYILMSALAIYSHLYAALAVASQWAAFPFLRRGNMPVRPFVSSVALIGAALVPLVPYVLTTSRSSGSPPPPRLSNIPGVFYVFAGNSGRLAHPDVVGLALMAAYLGLCLWALLAPARSRADADTATAAWRYGFVLTWLCLPVVVAFCIAVVRPKVAPFYPYYLIVCLPPFVLLAAAGLAAIRRPPVFAAVLAAVVSFGGYETYLYYRDFQKEDVRDATYRLLSLAAPGDAVVFDAPYGRDGFDYYKDRVPGAPPVVILPTWRDVSASYRRVWLFVNSGADTRADEAGLARMYSPAREWTFPGIRLVLYERLGISGSGDNDIIRTNPVFPQTMSFERRGYFPRPETIGLACCQVG